MTVQRGIDGPEPPGGEPIAGPAARYEKRPVATSTRLAIGTLACPVCDAPVVPAASPVSPADPLGCGFCQHSAAVRDFLSLAAPPRPTRVEVLVVRRTRD